MSRNSEREMLIARLARAKNLYESCPDEAIFEKKSLELHIDSINKELELLPDVADSPRLGEMSLLFDGEPVQSVVGIRADFVPKAIESFQEIVNARQTQVLRRLPKKDRINFHPKPLMITGTARGSFGFQFQESEDSEISRVIGDSCTQEAIKQSIEIIEIFKSTPDAELKEKVGGLDQRSIHAISIFFDHAKDFNASVKIETDCTVLKLDKTEVMLIAERSKRASQENQPDAIDGRLTGLMINGKRFEFQPEEGKCFSGSILDSVDPSIFAGFLKQKCTGIFQKTREVKQGKGKKPRWKWELIDIVPIDS